MATGTFHITKATFSDVPSLVSQVVMRVKTGANGHPIVTPGHWHGFPIPQVIFAHVDSPGVVTVDVRFVAPGGIGGGPNDVAGFHVYQDDLIANGVANQPASSLEIDFASAN